MDKGVLIVEARDWYYAISRGRRGMNRIKEYVVPVKINLSRATHMLERKLGCVIVAQKDIPKKIMLTMHFKDKKIENCAFVVLTPNLEDRESVEERMDNIFHYLDVYAPFNKS